MPESKHSLVEPLDRHNLDLLAAVHPPEHRNPVPRRRYNLVVIGAGPAGLVAAAGAAGLGASVALIERGLLGGDCLNVGCVPSKALLRSARAVHEARSVEAYGAKLAGSIEPDFAAAMARMRRLRARLAPADSAARFRALGIDVFLGHGRFTDRDAIEVGGARLRFQRALIATGARALVPPIPGLREIEPRTNETIFWLERPPRRLIVIGAGPIGCELSQAFRRLGCEVAIVSLDPRLIPRDDPDAAHVLHQQFLRERIEMHLGAKVVGAERKGEQRTVTFEGPDGVRAQVSGDEVLVAIGRVANTSDLGLDVAGVAHGRGGIEVDARLRTSNRAVYAAGDVASIYQFTHAADAAARMVLANAFFFGRARADCLIIPWCTFTDPEVAHVGLYPEEAKAAGHQVDTLTIPFDDIDRAVLDGDGEGFARVHLVKGKDRILGATLVAPHAGDMLQEMVLAMTQGIGLGRLSSVIHPYPTRVSVWARLADLRRRDALTPRVKALFESWFRWGRGGTSA